MASARPPEIIAVTPQPAPKQAAAPMPAAAPSTPADDTPEWYPGFRPETLLSMEELALLQEVMKNKDKTEAKLTSNDSAHLQSCLIKKLYMAATTASVVADHFHGVAQRAGTELVAAHQRAEQFEAGAAEFGKKHKEIIEAVTKRAVEVRQTLEFQDRQRKETELTIMRWQRELAQHQADLQALTKQKETFSNVTKQMRELLTCPICCEVALLPKVLGTCGHIACQSCLKGLDDVAYSTLVQASAAGGASARQHLSDRRCPLCRTEIIGQAFPVLALKDVARLLVEHELIEVSEETVKKSVVGRTLAFEKETPESKHMTALQMGCWAQSQLAQHSVAGVIARVLEPQWLNGVYILFEAAVSRVFFETFATTLHGKAGGVNVLVNTAQRMLAVQLHNRKLGRQLDAAASDSKANAVAGVNPAGNDGAVVPAVAGGINSPGPKQHLLIKVSTDGRFVMTLTPAPAAAPTPAVDPGAAAAPAPDAGAAAAPALPRPPGGL